MTQARLTCGECGAPLTLGDAACPNCGSPVELPALPAAAAARAPKRPASRPPQKPAPQPRRDPWPWIALAAIITLAAVVIYTQWGRGPAPEPAAQQPATALPAQNPDPSVLLRLQQAADADARNPEAQLRLANALQDAGQFARAVESYRNFLRLRPKDPDARVDLGICLYQMGLADSSDAPRLFRSAVQEMQTAVAGTPNHQPAAFNLGIVYLQLGSLDSSNIWFRRAVALNKTSDLGTRAQRILEQHQLAQ